MTDAQVQQGHATHDLADEIPRSLFRNAALFGIDLSMLVSLFNRPAVWIPRAVSDDAGGRATLYQLPMHEPTLMGFYVVENRIVTETITRTGDRSYKQDLATKSGEILFSGNGDLEELDSRIGYGRIVFQGKSTVAATAFLGTASMEQNQRVWVLWSCIQTDEAAPSRAF